MSEAVAEKVPLSSSVNWVECNSRLLALLSKVETKDWFLDKLEHVYPSSSQYGLFLIPIACRLPNHGWISYQAAIHFKEFNGKTDEEVLPLLQQRINKAVGRIELVREVTGA